VRPRHAPICGRDHVSRRSPLQLPPKGGEKKHGFTLVELLVVVSIIALLMAILLPALGKARETARMVVCLSQQRQLGLATRMYIGDNAGWYPAVYELPHALLSPNAPDQGTGQDSGFIWCEAIFDYVAGPGKYSQAGVGTQLWNSVRYFRCPSDPLGVGPYGQNPAAIPNTNSYAMNWQRNNYGGTWDGIGYAYGETRLPGNHNSVHTKESMVQAPADTFLYVDLCSGGYRYSWRHANSSGIRSIMYNGVVSFPDPGIHLGKFNWVFCDGHAQTLDVYDTMGTGDVNNCKGIWTKTPGD
ncbi:MAG: prepilin-type N-terminal cleavage/methylation domain-containing protein, partial [Phycisphaerales bacterium]